MPMVSEDWVKPVKISLLEQAIEAAFNLDRIKASPKATRVSIACNALAWLDRLLCYPGNNCSTLSLPAR